MESLKDHPSQQQLQAFAHGALDGEEQLAVEAHIESCDECCTALRQIPDDTFIAKFKLSDTAMDDCATRPSGPPRIGASETSLPAELANHPRYEILRRLGGGGMGSVFAANHRLMERDVAIKVINESLLENKTAVDRFAVEMKAAAKLSHPNIVNAFDADEVDGIHFLVMEYVEGVNLSELVEQKGPLPISQACDHARQVALGLGHAHDHEMVHRDIKPKNLMLANDSTVKILDFGLARFARRRDVDPDGVTQGEAGITMAGVAIGTPDYLAPEQIIDARAADIRSDIYSLGCTLYFLLTGQPPHPGGSSVEKLSAHLEQSPRRIDDLRSDVPAGLVTIVDRMLHRDPEQRYQTPGEVARALEPLANASALPSITPHPQGGRRRGQPMPVVQPAIQPSAGASSKRPRGRGLLVAGTVASLGVALLAALMIPGLLGVSPFADREESFPLTQLAGAEHGSILADGDRLEIVPHDVTTLCGDGRGPIAYDEIEGNFMITAQVKAESLLSPGSFPTKPQNWAGIVVTQADPRLAREQPAAGYWIYAIGVNQARETGTFLIGGGSELHPMLGRSEGLLRMARIGNKLYALEPNKNHSGWNLVSSRDCPPDQAAVVGLSACAYHGKADLRATFEQVSIEVPVSEGQIYAW